MASIPRHESHLQDAQRSWRDGTGPSRFATQLQGGLNNKLINVEYEFLDVQGKMKCHAHLDKVCVALDEPVGLSPVAVAKPWGQEIWYTGMEIRGESSIEAQTGTLALSSYLALAPEQICRQLPIVLLKILDPKPEPVLGDLYLEVHESKHEVYVVSRIDPLAWPSGIGAIRMGANQQLRQEYASDREYRAAYLAAVRAYEAIRRQIDDGVADPVETALTEKAARMAMDQFTHVLPLGVGDVVTVSPWLPHSLQHGVRVIEFQTPTYERRIISFAQRVVTQPHWDSEYAIEHLDLEPPTQANVTSAFPGAEQIADFADFSAWRIELDPGENLQLPMPLPYAVCMVENGTVGVCGLLREAEQACFVPATALPLTLHNPTPVPAVCLVASVIGEVTSSMTS